MKKTLLASAFTCLALLSYSMDTTGTRLKPLKGTFTTQVGMAMSNSLPNVLSLGLNGRYFIKDQLALRLTLMMQSEKLVENFDEFDDGSGGSGKYTTSTMTNALIFGVEKHCNGTRRLSPYGGLELGFGTGSIKEVGENSNGNFYVPSYSEDGVAKISQLTTGAFLGFDYWVAEGLYIGIEYTFFGYFSYTEKRGDKSITDQGVTTKEFTPEFKASGFTTINALPVFRLGWRF
jgi:hypothetical protein